MAFMAGIVAAAGSPASRDFGAEEEGKVTSADVAAALTGGSYLSVVEKRKKELARAGGAVGSSRGVGLLGWPSWAGSVAASLNFFERNFFFSKQQNLNNF